jgi:hypothetical protein
MSHTAIRRRLLGLVLRDFRRQYGYTTAEAGDLLDWPARKIARLEAGHPGVAQKELQDLLTVYGASDEEQHLLLSIEESAEDIGPSWWRPSVDFSWIGHREYLAVEELASQILIYSPSIVPELVQTPAYAYRLALANPEVHNAKELVATEAVELRQATILTVWKPRIEIVIGEAALRARVIEPFIKQEQMLHLAEISHEHPSVTVRVLPFSAGLSAAGGLGTFSTLRFAAMPQLGLTHIAGLRGGQCHLTHPDEFDPYVEVFRLVQDAALGVKASRELILRLREKFV